MFVEPPVPPYAVFELSEGCAGGVCFNITVENDCRECLDVSYIEAVLP
jgi:hypothetical protein